jgi:hypothetical protein
MNYFRICTDDKSFPNRWFLDEPCANGGKSLDAREFTYGRPYNGPVPVTLPIQQSGRPVAFNLAAFDMPVVIREIGDIFRRIASADVQLFPVTVPANIRGYEVLNAARSELCLDEELSGVTKWGPDDGRPDKIGQYHHMSSLVIDPLRTNNRHVFRIRGWEVALIVSDFIRQAIESERLPELGVIFQLVSPSD